MAKKDNTVKSFILRVDADMNGSYRSLGCGRISQHQWPNPVHSGPSLTKGRTVEEEKTARPQNDDKS